VGIMSNREWLKQLAATETKTWMTAIAPHVATGSFTRLFPQEG
jgi:hypothetical protein